MIQLANNKLCIVDSEGHPVELDLGLLEHDLVDAFRRLGFRDVWMAEDVSMTVEEKIRESDATPMTRSDVDLLVISVLNASGFPDVAGAYADAHGKDPYEEVRKAMHPWTKEGVAAVIRRTLPVTRHQQDELCRLCLRLLESSGITSVTDKLLSDLALHFLLNNVRSTKDCIPEAGASSTSAIPSATQSASLPSGASSSSPLSASSSSSSLPSTDWREALSSASRALIKSGVLRALPISLVFPRARVSLDVALLAGQNAGGWLAPMPLSLSVEAVAPSILELLVGMRGEIARQHPLQADSPSHVVVPSFMAACHQGRKRGEKRADAELQQALADALDAFVAQRAKFQVVITIK